MAARKMFELERYEAPGWAAPLELVRAAVAAGPRPAPAAATPCAIHAATACDCLAHVNEC